MPGQRLLQNAVTGAEALITLISGQKTTVPSAMLNGPFVYTAPENRRHQKAPVKARKGAAPKFPQQPLLLLLRLLLRLPLPHLLRQLLDP